MKTINIFFTIVLLAMMGCKGHRQSDTFITIDVTASYPPKELILQDFMDVEYIPLETTIEFLCEGKVQAIGKDLIILTSRMNRGDILIFDRNGKGIRKINRMGRGGEEYTQVIAITLDEENGELFVNNGMRTISVYDLFGKFKRSFVPREGFNYGVIYNYDNENLICNNGTLYAGSAPTDYPSFVIVSKQDGSTIHDIYIPFKQKKLTTMPITDADGNFRGVAMLDELPIIPFHDNWILSEPSSDTVFRLSPDFSMTPFIIRSPSIQSMNPEVFLFPSILTDRYYFMRTDLKDLNHRKTKGIMYDTQEKTVFEYAVYNDDFSTKKWVGMFNTTINSEIAFWQAIGADILVEAYTKGQLKGKLKEIASELEEDSNPIIMLVKYKK